MSITIEFHPEGPSLIRGKEMRIKVLVHFEQATRVRGISATFEGFVRTEASYVVTTTDHQGKVKTETKTAVERTQIVQQSELLFGSPSPGFFSGMGDAVSTLFGGGSAEEVEAGKYEYEICVEIPADAPASFKGTNCEVGYHLNVRVDLPAKFDKRATHQLRLDREPVSVKDISPTYVTYPEEGGRGFWERTFGKDVVLNLAVDCDAMTTGDTVNGMLTIDAGTPINLSRIGLSLIGDEKCTAQGHSSTGRHQVKFDDIDSPNAIGHQSTSEFVMSIPEWELPHSVSGPNYSIEWFVEVRLSIAWATDPVIRLPVVLY